MKKLMDQWPYEFWPLEALGGLVTVGMLIFALLMIVKNIHDGILKAGFERQTHPDQDLAKDRRT